jgi:hypothetical protein
MQIDTEDRRLTARERHMLRQIATRLETKAPRQLPHHYQQEIDRVFGYDCEPETNRWER